MTLGSSNLKRKKTFWPVALVEERFAFPRQPEVEVSRQVGRQLDTNKTRSSQMDENSKTYYDLVGCFSRRKTSADVNGVAFTRRTTGYPIDDDFHERFTQKPEMTEDFPSDKPKQTNCFCSISGVVIFLPGCSQAFP